MTFADVLELHRVLRQRIVVHAGAGAFVPINVPCPTRDDDELSFLRLVAWSYVLLQESGRISLRLLRELAGRDRDPLIEDVSCLRTWTAHNLSLEKESDVIKIKRAWAWFRGRCGKTLPLDSDHWKLCFGHLCEAVGEMLRAALNSSEVLDDPLDGPRNVEELRRRVDREWEAYRFDQFLVTAASRLGFTSVDPVALRKRKLDAWRKVVATAHDESIERLLTLRMEADLLELLGSSLPMTAVEILERVPLHDTRELAALMLAIRSHGPIDCADLGRLLDALATELQVREAPLIIGGGT